MTPSEPQTIPRVVRIGGWLFQQRSWLPVPLALVLLFVRAGQSPPSVVLLAAGIATVAAGESIRLWAVRHIGVISRTRSDRLGPLVSTGPFALVRNPLYLGNIALWAGFALSARLTWMLPIVVLVMGAEYHAIVRWEERLLVARRGEEYVAYTERVPRWIPLSIGAPGPGQPSTTWRATFFSERGTLIAIAAGYLLLYFKLN